MKRYRVEIELPDDFKPCTINPTGSSCTLECQFAYYDDHYEECFCNEWKYEGDSKWCPVKLGVCIDD